MAKIKILQDEYETKVVDLFTALRIKDIVDGLQSGHLNFFTTYTDLLCLFFNPEDTEKIQSKYPYDLIEEIITAIVKNPYEDIEFQLEFKTFKEMNRFYKEMENA